MKLSATLLFFLLFQFGLWGQSTKLTELLKVAESIQDITPDSVKTNLYAKIYRLSSEEKNSDLRQEYYSLLRSIYDQQNDIPSNIELITKEILNKKRSPVRDTIQIAKLHVLLGYYHSNQGDVLSSIKSCKQALILRNYIDDPKIEEYYNYYLLTNLSVNYARIADYDNAIHLQSQALDYFIKTNNIRASLMGANNLGEYYFLQKDHKHAIEQYNFTLNQSEISEYEIYCSIAYNGKSKVFLAQQDYEQALEYNKIALSIAATKPKTDKIYDLLIEIFTTNSKSYQKTNNPQLASYNIKQALQIAKEYYGDRKHRRLAHLYNSIANMKLTDGELLEAEGLFSQAISSLPKDLMDVQLLSSINGIITLRHQLLRNESSEIKSSQLIALVDSAIVIYEGIRNNYQNDESRYDLAEYASNFISIGIETCYDQYTLDHADHYLYKALYFSEKAKAAALEDAIIRNKRISQNDQRILPQLEALKKLQVNQSHELELAKSVYDSSKVRVAQDKLRATRIELNMVVSQMDNTHESPHHPTISYNNIEKHLLDNDLSLIEFYLDDTYIYRFKLNEEGIGCRRLSVNDPWQSDIQLLLQSFQFENRHQFDMQSAHSLFNTFWPESLISSKNVIIIPDGQLSLLPFDVLVDANNHFLIENHNIHYASSVQSLIMQNKNTKKTTCNKKVLCVAPIFKNNSDLYLESSESEVQSISEVIQSKKLLNEDANKNNFNQYCNSYSILHLTTHAKVKDDLQSAYIQFYNEKLYLQELYKMSFNNELVVLSACETGLGKNEKTEGVLSLSRAFNYTGVPTVISSLWTINENSTSALFKHFYQSLSNSTSTSEALAEAKRSYLKDPNISTKLKTPYYWAGLVHWGNENVIELASTAPKSPYKLLIFAFLATIIVFFLLRNLLNKYRLRS